MTIVDSQVWCSHTSFLSSPLSSSSKSDFCWWCRHFILFLQNLSDFCCATKESKLNRILMEDELCGCISRIRFSMTLSTVSGVLNTSQSFSSSYRLADFRSDMRSATTFSLPATCLNFILYCYSLSAHVIVFLFITIIKNRAKGLWLQYKMHSAPLR